MEWLRHAGHVKLGLCPKPRSIWTKKKPGRGIGFFLVEILPPEASDRSDKKAVHPWGETG